MKLLFVIFFVLTFVTCMKEDQNNKQNPKKSRQKSLSSDSKLEDDFNDFQKDDEGCSTEKEIVEKDLQVEASNEPVSLQGDGDCSIN